jgi:hypothetical protein
MQPAEQRTILNTFACLFVLELQKPALETAAALEGQYILDPSSYLSQSELYKLVFVVLI